MSEKLKVKILLYTTMVESQRRYTYLLLAVAASAIALSLKNTEDNLLTWYLLPIGFAVIFWGLSFYNGLRNLRSTEDFIQKNLDHLDSEYNAMFEDDLIKNNEKTANFANWQFRFLVLGA